MSGAQLRAARKDLSRIEARLDRIGQEREDLVDQMAAAHADHVRLVELAAADAALDRERVELEDRWLVLAAALEG